MTLRPQEFSRIFKAPARIGIIITFQIVLAPILAIAFVKGFGLSEGAMLGLLLMTAMPGGAMSNIFTYLASGNVPLSISATVTATLTCGLTAPAVLWMTTSESFSIPLQLLTVEILVFMLTPLLTGMLLLRFAPLFATRASRIFIRISLALLSLHVIGALGSGRLDILAYGWKTPVAISLFGFVLMFLAVRGSMLVGYSRADASTMGFEIIIRNAFLALLVKADIYPAQAGSIDPVEQALLYVILFYSGVALAVGVCQVAINRIAMSRSRTNASMDEAPAVT